MDWNDWLNEDITSMYTRQEALKALIEITLVPMLKAEGFVLSCQPLLFGSQIASALYEYGGKSFLAAKVSQHPFRGLEFFEEYHLFFNHRMSYERWDSIWKKFYFWTELDSNARAIIEELCWLNIDLASSPAIIEYDDLFEEQDDSMVLLGHDDSLG